MDHPYRQPAMPRREQPDPMALKIGQRVKILREEQQLTLEGLAHESDLGSKGHLSDLEAGLVVPTVKTLAKLADRLEVLVLDLVVNPDEDDRQRLIDATRTLSKKQVRHLLRVLKEDRDSGA